MGLAVLLLGGSLGAVLVVLIGGSLFVQMPGMAVLWLLFAVQAGGKGAKVRTPRVLTSHGVLYCPDESEIAAKLRRQLSDLKVGNQPHAPWLL